MNIIIYLGIIVVIIGVFTCFLAIWAVVTHRENMYIKIKNEHLKQIDRVKNKISRVGK